MEKTKPTFVQRYALWVSGEEGMAAFILCNIAFMFFLVVSMPEIFTNHEEVSIKLGLGIPAIVFILAVFINFWLSKTYISKRKYGCGSMLVEVDSDGHVIRHRFGNMIKTLTGQYSYHEVFLGYDDWEKIHYNFLLKAAPQFELSINVSLLLKETGDFDPQEIYDLMVRSGLNDLHKYFICQLEQAIVVNQEKLEKFAEKYHCAEITDSQFCQQVLQTIQIRSPFSNIKVSQLMMEKPIGFLSNVQ